MSEADKVLPLIAFNYGGSKEAVRARLARLICAQRDADWERVLFLIDAATRWTRPLEGLGKSYCKVCDVPIGTKHRGVCPVPDLLLGLAQFGEEVKP